MSSLDQNRQLVINSISVHWPEWSVEKILACMLMDADRCGYAGFEDYLNAVIEMEGLGQ